MCLYDESAETLSVEVRRRLLVAHMQVKGRHTTQGDADAQWRRLTADAKQHVTYTPKCLINADMLTWVRGSFNAHFAGQKPERKVQLARDFEANHTVHDESLTRFVHMTNSRGEHVRVALPLQSHHGVKYIATP